MNALPLFLAAVAVLLSAGAFLLALRSGRGRTNPEASALAGEVARMGETLLSIREAVAGMPSALETLGSGISRLPGIVESRSGSLAESIEALPGRIALASGAAEVLAELRSSRESASQAIDRLDGIRQDVRAASAEQASASRELSVAVQALERSSGQDLAGTRESAAQLAAAVAASSARADAGATSQLEVLRAISASIAELPGLVGSAVDRLGSGDDAGQGLEQIEALRQANELARLNGAKLDAANDALGRLADVQGSALEQGARSTETAATAANELREAVQDAILALASDAAKTREVLLALPVRTAEEIATRPAPAPELEELAIAVRDAGALRGDSVRSIADAVSRVAERLEASAEDGRSARQDAADRLSQSLATLETVAAGVREALLPLGEALRGHGETVVPVVKGLEAAQDRFEEAAVSLRVNQVEFAASVGVFTSAAQDLSTGLGAFAREGLEDGSRDPAAVQQALLEALDRLLGGFAESLRATLVEADLRHREALVEIAARLPDGTKG